jgi:hypothetical protein
LIGALVDGLVLTHGEAAPGGVSRWAEKNAQEAALALGHQVWSMPWIVQNCAIVHPSGSW